MSTVDLNWNWDCWIELMVFCILFTVYIERKTVVEATQQSSWKMRSVWDAKLQTAMNADACKASTPGFRVYDRCCRIMKAKNWARYVPWRRRIHYYYFDCYLHNDNPCGDDDDWETGCWYGNALLIQTKFQADSPFCGTFTYTVHVVLHCFQFQRKMLQFLRFMNDARWLFMRIFGQISPMHRLSDTMRIQ